VHRWITPSRSICAVCAIDVIPFDTSKEFKFKGHLIPVWSVGIHAYQIFKIWYIFKVLGTLTFDLVYMKNLLYIWCIFVRGFCRGFQTTDLIYYRVETEKPIVVLKLHKKVVILLNIGVSMHFGLAESESGRELRILKNMNLALDMRF